MMKDILISFLYTKDVTPSVLVISNPTDASERPRVMGNQ